MIMTISPAELWARYQAQGQLDLIDVRTAAEFRAMHVEFAQNVPLDRLDPSTLRQQQLGTPERPLYVVCQSGSRSQQACQRLEAAGFTAVVNVTGGTVACDAAGLPMSRGKRAISLERQVRIAAGSLVLLGLSLGYVSPYFVVIAVFVGAGLVFSGVTDTCGMALLLGRMPWNQVR